MSTEDVHEQAGSPHRLTGVSSRKLTEAIDNLTVVLGSTVAGTDLDWQRIADVMRHRMDVMQASQNSIAELAGVSPTTLRDLYHARKDSYRRDVLVKVSTALGWGTDGLLRIGRGEDPADIERELAMSGDQSDVVGMLTRIQQGITEMAHELGEVNRRVARLEEDRR